MKNFWKVLANMAIPLLRAAGQAKEAEDDNSTGKDDAEGISLVYAADLLDALVNGKALPKAPEILK